MGAEVAVLTGDLIGSSRALPAAIDRTFLVLAEAAGGFPTGMARRRA